LFLRFQFNTKEKHMRLSTSLSAIALAVMACTAAQAADWSADSIGYRYYSGQSEPGTADKVQKNVLNFTHVSGDKLGSNLFSIDYLRSDNADPANGGGSPASEWYGFYKRTFSIGAMTGNKGGYGMFKDLGLTGRVDLGAKNTTFAPAPAKVRLGLSADLPVKGGFWNVGVEAYKETNNNGIVGKAVNFDTALALSSAWSVPALGGTFGGYFDMVGPKGTDGFGAATTTEVQLFASLMYDLNGPKGGLKAGVGFHMWNNKFGCDNDKTAVSNSCKSTSPMLLASYSF
jgi:hypothetical protein